VTNPFSASPALLGKHNNKTQNSSVLPTITMYTYI
jgi:hypothetical protein